MYLLTNANREPLIGPNGEYLEAMTASEAFALVASIGGGYVVDAEDGRFIWPPPSPVARAWEDSL